jgi:predicted nucleic acid-binding protein
MRLVFLDTGVLGMLCSPRGTLRAVMCLDWSRALLGAGVRLFIPEICDYEVRRKLIHKDSTPSLSRLDHLKRGFEYAPITTDAMQLAAELWAESRRRGRPTAPAESIDGDVILAAQALITANPGDVVTVATDNVRHLEQFVDAKLWEQIKD